MTYILRIFVMYLITCFSFWITSCEEEEETKSSTGLAVKTEMSGVGTLAIEAGANLNLVDNSDDDSVASSNVTLNSLKIPIYRINIYDSNDPSGPNDIQIYECPGAPDYSSGCYVEMVGKALSNILPETASVEMMPGTYDTIKISHADICEWGDGNFLAGFTASGKLDGETYYTKSDGKLSADGPAEEARFDYPCFTTTTLASPLVIGEEVARYQVNKATGENDLIEVSPTDLTIKMLFDLQFAAFIRSDTEGSLPESNIPNETTGEGTGTQEQLCASGQNRAICIENPTIAATIDPGDPTIERYVISDDSLPAKGCAGMVGIYVTSSGIPFGGYLRDYKYEGQNCDNHIKRESGISFESIKANNESLELGDKFKNFERKGHSGLLENFSYTVLDIDQEPGAAEIIKTDDVDYTAEIMK